MLIKVYLLIHFLVTPVLFDQSIAVFANKSMCQWVAMIALVTMFSFFSIGDYVEHKLFGKGKILVTEGAGSTAKLTILFSGKVRKKIIAKYANLIHLQTT